MAIDVDTHAPLTETFPQWVVAYGYLGDEDKAARIPTTITISKNNGELVRKYQKVGIEGQDVRYDDAGNKKIVPRVYFNIDLALSLKEPPLKISPKEEGTVLACSPLAPPNDLEEYRTFRVRYLQYGFESRMVIEVASGAPMREVFPFWWEVNYLYANDEDRESHAPSSIVIYRNLGYDTKRAEINRYEKVVVTPGGESVIYRDLAGKEKEVPVAYFDVMPEPPLETTN
jgi:hypothetical protein